MGAYLKGGQAVSGQQGGREPYAAAILERLDEICQHVLRIDNKVDDLAADVRAIDREVDAIDRALRPYGDGTRYHDAGKRWPNSGRRR